MIYKKENFPPHIQDRIASKSNAKEDQDEQDRQEEDQKERRKKIYEVQNLIIAGITALVSFDQSAINEGHSGSNRQQWNELLLWSLLAGKWDLAKLIMSAHRVPHQMGAALFSCCVLKKIEKICESAQVPVEEVVELRKHFESVGNLSFTA